MQDSRNILTSPASWREDFLSLLMYWKVYKNVSTMLKARGYIIPDHVNKIAQNLNEFRFHFNKCQSSLLLLQELCFVASKPPFQVSPNQILSKLPSFEDAISCVLDVNSLVVGKGKTCDNEDEDGDKDDGDDDDNINTDDSSIEHEQKEGIPYQDKKYENYIHIRQEIDSELQRLVIYLGEENLRIQQCFENEVLVLFCRKITGGALGIDSIVQLLKYQELLNNKHMILILHNEKNPEDVLTAAPRKKLQSLRYPDNEENKDGIIVEHFSFLEKSFDLMKCNNQSKIKRCTAQEKENLLKNFNLKEQQFETIALTDPVAAYYDFRQQDLCEVIDYDSTKSWVCVGINK